MKYQNENKIKSALESTIKSITEIIDVNTIVGAPIKTEENDLIIPISDVTIGILSGAGEYGKVSIFKSENDLPYSVGNGSIISIKPVSFLIKNQNGEFSLINVKGSTYERLIEKSLDVFDKIVSK